jgi:hypothetical protein
MRRAFVSAAIRTFAAMAVCSLSVAALADEETDSDDWPWGQPVAEELSGSIILESRLFLNPPRWPGQDRHAAALALQPEFYMEWDDYTSLTIEPFARLDNTDGSRSHFDMREAYLQIVRDDWELGVGIGKVFWGVTESQHLVDIVNQTDAIENLDMEDKLGQPMLNLTFIRDWGYVDVIYMPYFRDRTFPARRGRFRGAVVVDDTQTAYESGAGRWHPDFALRWSNSIGNWDVGAYAFHGTSREPTQAVGFNDRFELVLIPTYEIINQLGTDIQYTTGAWLWKLEALYRQGQKNRLGREQNYTAMVGGFEYSFYGVMDSNADLGLLMEYARDSRLNKSNSGFQNDIFAGARFALNDAQDTDLLAGVIIDLSTRTRMFSLEANRRIGESFKLTLEARLFTDVDAADILDGFRDDDMIQLELGYYF